ncbi:MULTISPECIES: hypothetical protein [unclassified Acidovorax]|uniref:hypothetical protein n=1 Tax=unclassified Acidovorax TaxID=2684926 RepID=UPI001178511E|nr:MULTISPECIES: hypothetical protein [unclassified Acidovorax]
MNHNLLLWRWSEAFDTPAKRKQAKLKFGDITESFATHGHHPAIGHADINDFKNEIEAVFGSDEVARPFVLELYEQCAVISYSSSVRFDLVPKVAGIGKKFGLNASEF